MFEYGRMSSTLSASSLQQRINDMQQLRLDSRALPTDAALGALLPGGALKAGAMYSVRGSWQLALSFLSAASTNGSWCGIVGCRDFGGEAAAELGIALDRCVVIPRPGKHALTLTSTLGETLSLVVARFDHRVSPADVERLAAKLRENGSALIVAGDWPRTESRLSVTSSRWSGLEAGYGLLRDRELTIRSEDRRGTRQHTLRFSRDGISSIDREAKLRPPLLTAV